MNLHGCLHHGQLWKSTSTRFPSTRTLELFNKARSRLSMSRSLSCSAGAACGSCGALGALARHWWSRVLPNGCSSRQLSAGAGLDRPASPCSWAHGRYDTAGMLRKHMKACKVLRNVLVKKLQISKLEIGATQIFFQWHCYSFAIMWEP